MKIQKLLAISLVVATTLNVGSALADPPGGWTIVWGDPPLETGNAPMCDYGGVFDDEKNLGMVLNHLGKSDLFLTNDMKDLNDLFFSWGIDETVGETAQYELWSCGRGSWN